MYCGTTMQYRSKVVRTLIGRRYDLKYMIVLLLAAAAIPSLGQELDRGLEGSENTMPDWEGWSGESACEEDYESPLDDVLEDIDVALSVNVLEHLQDPERVFEEVCRTLKPGGKFILRPQTPVTILP